MNSPVKVMAIIALIAFPSTVLATDVISGLVFFLVLLSGIYTLIARSDLIGPLTAQEKIFFVSVSVLFLSAVLTSLFRQVELSRADRFINLLMAIPVFMLFKAVRVSEKYIWTGLVAGTLIAASVGLFQVYGGSLQPRATGEVHPIIFGDLALMMGVMSLAGFDWFKRQHQALVLIPLLSLVAGLAASVLSLSRGGWVALPLVTFVFIAYLMRYLSWKKLVLVFLLVMLAISSIYLVPQTGVQQRVKVTVDNINGYMSSQSISDSVRSTSIGARFEMWQAAIDIFQQHPLLGSGWGEYNQKARELVERGLYNESIADFSHPHNQFLSALAKGGLLALLAMLLLFLLPAAIFLRCLQHAGEPERERAALAGMLLLVGFIGFSLSEAILERSRSVIFFSFYLAIFMALVLREKQSSETLLTENSSSVDAV